MAGTNLRWGRTRLIIVSASVLALAVGGIAVAGGALDKQEKNAVKKISKKQAIKQINKLAQGLSVDHASTSGSASTAGSANSAETADTAKSADSATNASNATNADKVDGKNASDFLAANTVGVPVAGANIDANGIVRRSFNHAGGAATVNKSATGIYVVTFPGLEGKAYFDNSIVLVSLAGVQPGEITRQSQQGNAYIATYNSSGALADRAFEVVLFVPGAQSN